MPRYEARPITAEQTHPLRHAVLRPHQPIREMAYPGDDDPATVHLGAFDRDIGDGHATAAGIVSLYREPMPGAARSDDWRLRGMAVAPPLQGRGLGAVLVTAGLAAVQNAGAARVWCNARTPAVGFYQRLGFTAEGEPFDIPGIGMHYVMWVVLAEPRQV